METANWRLGAASVYESEWSLLRKYCYLNRIRRNAIQLGMHRGKATEIGENARSLSKSLARLLGEPREVLRYVGVEHFFLPAEIGDKRQYGFVVNLRYCHECMHRGYHSPIHQLPWVTVCPIHGTTLYESCHICGKKVSLARWQSLWGVCGDGAGKRDECACNSWPEIREWLWPRGLKYSETRPIGAYLKWVQTLRSAPEVLFGKEALEGLHLENANVEAMVEIFSIWCQIVPPPPSVAAFLVNQHPSRPITVKTQLSSEQSLSAIALIRDWGYIGIAEGLALNLHRQGEKGAWNYLSKRIRTEFAGVHVNCAHQRQLASMNIEIAAFFNIAVEFDCFCPRYPVVEMIQQQWLGFWNDGDPRHLGRIESLSTLIIGRSVDNDLLSRGLGEATLKKRSGRGTTQAPIEHTSVKWNNDLLRIFSHWICFRLAAIASLLIDRYLNRKDPKEEGQWWKYLRVTDVHNPYLLVYVDHKGQLVAKIWSRHRPRDMPSMRQDQLDWHPRDAVSYFLSRKRKIRKSD